MKEINKILNIVSTINSLGGNLSFEYNKNQFHVNNFNNLYNDEPLVVADVVYLGEWFKDLYEDSVNKLIFKLGEISSEILENIAKRDL